LSIKLATTDIDFTLLKLYFYFSRHNGFNSCAARIKADKRTCKRV